MSDIVVAARLALRLLNTGFDEANAADVCYTNFQNDIFNLHLLLEKLNEALQNAQRCYVRYPHPIGVPVYEPLSVDLESERKAFTGDFVATLRAADALLTENRRVRLGYGKDPNSLRRYLSEQEPRVDDLRCRLRLHIQKLIFVLDRLSSELLTQLPQINSVVISPNALSSGLEKELYGLQRQQTGGSEYFTGRANLGAHSISGRIANQFEAALHDDPSVTSFGIPINRAFDMLLTFFEQSTNGQDQTPEKYLAFLKTRWLLERIRASPEYRSACPRLYLQNATNQIVQALDTQMQPGRLIQYNENLLLSLPDSCFRIWPGSTIPTVRPALPTTDSQNEMHPLTARATEEKVIRVPLASASSADEDSLTVFKSSDERFRLVVQSSQASRPGNTMIVPQSIYTREDRLIPRYALPNLVSPSMEMAIFSRNEETLYTFDSLRDIYDFQSALTGYDVSHDQQGIRCQFSDEASLFDCRGRIQLWQEPIVASTGDEDLPSPESSTIGGSRSRTGWTSSVFGSIAPSLATTNTVHRADGGWEANSVKLAHLTVFTELTDRKGKRRLAIMSVELGLGVNVDPKECRCCRDYDTCSKLVLTKGKKNKFKVSTLYCDLDSSGQPNTNTFDLLPFRTPQHPTFKKLTTKQTQYLVLKFPSLQEKRLFDNELQLRFRVRDAQRQNQLDFVKTIRRKEGQRPGKEEPLPPLRSLSFTPSILSLPPKIDVPDNGPTLTDAMKNMNLTGNMKSLELMELTDDPKSMKFTELTGSAAFAPLQPSVVEVSGDMPLVELATSPTVENVGTISDVKFHDPFYELPGAIPWFPA